MTPAGGMRAPDGCKQDDDDAPLHTGAEDRTVEEEPVESFPVDPKCGIFRKQNDVTISN